MKGEGLGLGMFRQQPSFSVLSHHVSSVYITKGGHTITTWGRIVDQRHFEATPWTVDNDSFHDSLPYRCQRKITKDLIRIQKRMKNTASSSSLATDVKHGIGEKVGERPQRKFRKQAIAKIARTARPFSPKW